MEKHNKKETANHFEITHSQFSRYLKKLNMSHSQRDLLECIAIEAGLYAGKNFKQIAKQIKRDPAAVASEVKRNREMISGLFFLNNDCRYAQTCKTNRNLRWPRLQHALRPLSGL